MIEEQQKLGYKARYVFALIGNQILQKVVQEHKTRIENYCQQNQCSKTEYVEFLYRTQNSWSKKRRVVAKLKCVYEEGNSSNNVNIILSLLISHSPKLMRN